MGAVYLGLDSQLDRQVAIKILPEETADDPAARERFLREARAAAALNHPSICAIYSIEQEKEVLFLVLEYVRGRTFRDLIVGGGADWPPKPAVAASYIHQVAEALAVAHETGIIHRDIKSSNLMLTAEQQVKVLDFGLAKVSGAAGLTENDFPLGTPAYASPEQLRGETVDARSDLWSLGVVFYEVLTGRLPFTGENFGTLMRAIVNDKPRSVSHLRPDVPGAIEQVIEVLLSKNPDRRYGSAHALAEAINPLAAKAPRAGPGGARIAPDNLQILLGTTERRNVTFLHIELAAKASSEDPEDFQASLENAREICAKVVERHGGALQPWVGNTVVALFGYPEAREHAARLAVEAGLALSGSFGRGQLGFEEKAGIVSALAVVEAGGGDAIVSEGFELARALAGQAGPNEVLVAEAIEKQVEGRFEFGKSGDLRAGPRQLRFRQAVHASTARTRQLEIPSATFTPLAGRDQELQTLLRQWERAAQGEAHITLIGGEPGLGKSRLVHELKRHVANNPAAAMAECFCAPQSANSAFFPIVQVLERIWFESDIRAMTSGEKLRAIEGSLAELGFALPETVPLFAQLLGVPAPQYRTLEYTPERQRSLTLEALATVAIERASRQPFLFIVEDLQWADPSTLEVLRILAGRAPTVSLMAVYTHRPEYVAQWPIAGHVSTLSLARLARAESLALMTAAGRGAALDRATIEQIAENSEGVPLFLEELTKTVVEAGTKERRGGRLPVPGNLRDSFNARLDRLGASRNVVRMASVLGREFPQTLLAAVAGLSPQELQENLDRLVDAEVFFVRGSGERRTYIFKHALLQNVAYESLVKKGRGALHRQVAELLVNQFQELAERRPEVVARHYTEAGLGEQAIIFWHKAGMAALERSAYLEAISHFEEGLRVLKALPAERRGPEHEVLLLASLGPALIATRGFGAEEVGETFRRAEELLPKSASSPLVLPTLWGVWVYSLVRSRLDHALATAVRMIESGRRSNDDGMLLEGFWTAGNALFWKGDLKASRKHLEDAEALYDPTRFGHHAFRFGQDTLVATLCYQSFTYCFLGLYAEAAAAGDRAIEVARARRHPFSIAWALIFRAALSTFLADFSQALTCGNEAVEYCQKQAYPFWISAGLAYSGRALVELGDATKGIERLMEGIAMSQAIGSRVIEPLLRGLLAEAMLLSGNGEAALAESEAAIRQAEEEGVGGTRFDLLRIRGLALAPLGRGAEAEASIRKCLEESRAASCRHIELRAATDLKEFTGEAAPLARLCAEFAESSREPPVLARARQVLARR